jgi:hypothetical protein
MFKKDSRKGLALGGIFALLASLFTVAPAAQADEDGLVITPASGTSYTMLVTEEFVLNVRLGSNVDVANDARVRYIVSKPEGTAKVDQYEIRTHNTVSATSTLASMPGGGSDEARNYVLSASQTVSSTITPSFGDTTVNRLILRPASYSGNVTDVTSVSPATSVTVTAFLDLTPDGLLDSSEPFTTVTVNFVPWSALGASVTLTQPVQGDTEITASAAVSGVNFEQLNGKFAVYFTTSAVAPFGDYNRSSRSASISPEASARGELSYSVTVSALAANTSVSAFVGYSSQDSEVFNTVQYLAAATTAGASTRTFTDWTFSPDASSNNIAQASAGSLQGDARVNAAFTFDAKPYTGSTTVSVAVVPTMTVAGAPKLSTDK